MGFDEILRAKLKAAAKAAPERKRVMLYLEEDTYDALRSFAKRHGLSMNAVATLAVEAMIETEDA